MIRSIKVVESYENYCEKCLLVEVVYEWDYKIYIARLTFSPNTNYNYMVDKIESMITREISVKIREQVKEKLLENEEILKLEIMRKLTE